MTCSLTPSSTIETKQPIRTGAEALHELARVFVEEPNVVLQRLVDLAVEHCGAASAGISLEELENESGSPRFRWIVVSGSFSRYLNGTTPRNFSPCGTCLDRGRPQLYTVTKPYYDFLGVVADPITDGMLIPWNNGAERGTIWAVSHNSAESFDPTDYKLLNSLADFAAIAIRHQRQVSSLRAQERDLASAERANQLAHQINNPLQSLTNALYLVSRDESNATAYMEYAQRELQTLSDLVRKLLTESATQK